VSVLFSFDAAAWEIPEARWTVETIATLLEHRWRIAPWAPASAGELLVHVGSAAGAPVEAAAVVEVQGWPKWSAATLEAASFEDVPLLCPPGSLVPTSDARVLPWAWLRSLGFLLAREEEYEDARRDQWECYSGTYSRQHALGVLDRPLVNLAVAALARRIATAAGRRARTLEPLPRWKDGARFAACLTHDVDDVALYSGRQALRLLLQARAPQSYAFRAGLSGLGRAWTHRGAEDPYSNFHRWLAEEEGRGRRSTFYFVPPDPRPRHEYDPLYRLDDRIAFDGRRVTVAEVMRAMESRGHEVGLHGSYRSHRDGAELGRQKHAIEFGADTVVRGVRQHFLRFDVRATWAAQVEAGFRYDTTLGYNEAVGFRAGIAAPFRPWSSERKQSHDLWELPLTLMDGALFRTLKLGSKQAAEAVTRHLDQVEAAGGLAVLLWHPNGAAEALFPGWWATYRHLLDELGRRNAWVATARTIADWWRDRTAGASAA
jgi:peptidoglycan/xylan/chitin deacetylase (PgdA/CDA1 family)